MAGERKRRGAAFIAGPDSTAARLVDPDSEENISRMPDNGSPLCRSGKIATIRSYAITLCVRRLDAPHWTPHWHAANMAAIEFGSTDPC